MTFKDGSTFWVCYAAIADALPGRHLIVFAPDAALVGGREKWRRKLHGAPPVLAPPVR